MSDSTRRGLRTALQVALSALSGGALKGILAIFGVEMTVEAYAAFVLTWTPVVTVLFNALEDKTGKAILIPKANPDPEPTQPPYDGAVVPDIGQTIAEDNGNVRKATVGGETGVGFNDNPAIEQFTFRPPEDELSVHPPIGDPMGTDWQPGENQVTIGGAVPPHNPLGEVVHRRTRRQLLELNRSQLRDELDALGADPLPTRATKAELVDAVFVAERRRS